MAHPHPEIPKVPPPPPGSCRPMKMQARDLENIDNETAKNVQMSTQVTLRLQIYFDMNQTQTHLDSVRDTWQKPSYYV